MASQRTARFLLLLVAGVLVMLVAVAIFHGPGEPALDPVFPARETGGVGPPRIESPTAVAVEPASEPGDRVHVVVETRARVLPARPSRPRVCLVSASGKTRYEGRFVAGLAASPLARRIEGQQLVRFAIDGGRVHYRVTRLVAADRGTADVDLEMGLPRIGSGRVVDGQTGASIPGASVFVAGVTATSDGDGRFRLDEQPVADGLPLVVRSPGYVPVFRVLSAPDFEGMARRPIVLTRGVSVRIRLLGPGREGARLTLFPAAGRDTMPLGYPFFFQDLAPMVPDGDGIVTVDLPTGAAVRVLVTHPQGPPVVSSVIAVGTRTVMATVKTRRGPRVRGALVDASGRPFDGSAVVTRTSRAGDRGLVLDSRSWLLPPIGYVAARAGYAEDAGAALDLPRIQGPKGRCLVTVEAPGFTGLEFELGSGITDLGDVPILPAGRRGAPRILLTGAAVRRTVTLEIGGRRHGPYPWAAGEPFPIELTQPSLVSLRISVGARTQALPAVVVSGETTVPVD